MSETIVLIERVSAVINQTLNVLSSGVFWLGTGAGALLLFGAWHIFAKRPYTTSKITLSIPFGLGNVVYEASDEDRILAWKMYVQLKTRKAALPFDDEFDLVAKVHDSLGNIFPVARRLLSEIPPQQVARCSGITDFVLRVLNDGVRPHLTQWHASFDVWLKTATTNPENRAKTPHELQKEFPQYEKLVSSLKTMNVELAKYAEELLDIVQTKPRRFKHRAKPVEITPEPPTRVATSNASVADPQLSEEGE